MSGMNWSETLGELGLESPGYQATLQDCRENPWVKPGKRRAKAKGKKAGKRAQFPSVKHGFKP
jgi:hypothetical protein